MKKVIDIIKEEIGLFEMGAKGEQYWTTNLKPQVLADLSKINAPNEWKQMVLKLHRTAATAHNNSHRMSWDNLMYSYGDTMADLMEKLGSPVFQPYGQERNHPNYKYWSEYCKISGSDEDANVSDWLS